jgi:hypothetical protein
MAGRTDLRNPFGTGVLMGDRPRDPQPYTTPAQMGLGSDTVDDLLPLDVIQQENDQMMQPGGGGGMPPGGGGGGGGGLQGLLAMAGPLLQGMGPNQKGQLGAAMQDPQIQQMVQQALSNPQVMQQIMQMATQGMGGGGGGGGGGMPPGMPGPMDQGPGPGIGDAAAAGMPAPGPQDIQNAKQNPTDDVLEQYMAKFGYPVNVQQSGNDMIADRAMRGKNAGKSKGKSDNDSDD